MKWLFIGLECQTNYYLYSLLSELNAGQFVVKGGAGYFVIL